MVSWSLCNMERQRRRIPNHARFMFLLCTGLLYEHGASLFWTAQIHRTVLLVDFRELSVSLDPRFQQAMLLQCGEGRRENKTRAWADKIISHLSGTDCVGCVWGTFSKAARWIPRVFSAKSIPIGGTSIKEIARRRQCSVACKWNWSTSWLKSWVCSATSEIVERYASLLRVAHNE